MQFQAARAPAFRCLEPRGFFLVETTGIRTRLRAEQRVHWSLSIEWWMDWDGQGEPSSHGWSNAFVELGGSGSLDRREGDEMVRYWKPRLLYEGRRFPEALATLESDLLQVADVLQSWTEADILSATRVVLTL